MWSVNPASFSSVPLWGSLSAWWFSYWSRYVGSRLSRRLARISCVLSGHVEYPVFGYGKLHLQCLHCKRETPGFRWDVRRVKSKTLRFGRKG